MSTTEDQMEVAESEDSGVATGSDTMSTSSAASTATLVASPPPSVDGDLGTFDSGLLSPTSVTSSTQWSNSGHQNHVTGQIRSDGPSHHGHPNAAHSGASSDSGFFGGTARPGVTDSAQKTQEWIPRQDNIMDAGGSEDSGVQDCTSIHSQSTRSASSLRGPSISAQSQTSGRRDNGPTHGTHTVLPGQQPRPTQGRASLDSGFGSASSRSSIQGHSALPNSGSTTLDGAGRTREWIQSSPFEVYVKDMEGKTVTIETKPDEKVTEFRKKVAQKTGTAGTYLTTMKGKSLENNLKLSDYNIKQGQTLLCNDRLIGGEDTPK